MKKIVALLLVLCMALSISCAFAAEVSQDLKNARSFVLLMYKDKPENTSKDYEVMYAFNNGGIIFPITWTVDNDAVKVVVNEEKETVTIDVDERSPEEVPYVLTATITDEAGNSVSVSFNRLVPVSMSLFGLTEQEIVAKAFRLQDGEYLPSPTVLTGVITKADEYSAQYGNLNVWFIPAGMSEEYEMEAYRLSGEGADSLAVGDTITVAGKVKNYKNTIEFDQGCKLIPAEKAEAVRTVYDAFTLEAGEAMEAPCTLTGVITKADAYNPDYGNLNVWFVPEYVSEEYEMEAYRLKGEGADNLAVGDTITVTGIIKNYTNSSGVVTIEFDQGCTLDAVVKAD